MRTGCARCGISALQLIAGFFINRMRSRVARFLHLSWTVQCGSNFRPLEVTMSAKVIPFGYGARGSMEQLDALMQDERTALIDTRYSPHARRVEWRQGALKAKYDRRYMWLGETLGNINYNNGGPIQLAQPEQGIGRLVNGLQSGWSLVLLCQCPNYEQCHRRVIVEMLTAQMPEVEVVHSDGQAAPVNTIPALSIRQPYAFMLANPDALLDLGIPAKCIENRDWRTRYRGPLLIHASKMFDRDALPSWSRRFPGVLELPQTADGYERGGIVGMADLVDVIEQSNDPWFVGRYGFFL